MAAAGVGPFTALLIGFVGAHRLLRWKLAERTRAHPAGEHRGVRTNGAGRARLVRFHFLDQSDASTADGGLPPHAGAGSATFKAPNLGRCRHPVGMRSPIEIPPFYLALIICTAALVALVFAEGWTWPLKAAACMIPVSLLIG